MVEVAGANRMMPGLDMFVMCASKGGAEICGFHSPAIQFQTQFERLKAVMPNMERIASSEQEGYISFLATRRTTMGIGTPAVKTFRREVHTFFRDLPKFLASIDAPEFEQMILTGSAGSLFLALVYRE